MLSSGAGGAHQGVPAVHRRILENFAVASTGDDLSPGGMPEADGDERIPLHVHDATDGGRGQTVHSHLPQIERRPAPMGATVINRSIHQLEDFAAEELDVALFRRELTEVGRMPRAGAVCRLASHDQSQCQAGAPQVAAGHSMANSRLNTTSKLNVLLLLRVSMCSAMRLSRAGIPMIFSCALRPSSFRPSRLSIFQ